MAALRIFAQSAIAGIRVPNHSINLKKQFVGPASQLQRRWETTITVGLDIYEKKLTLPDFEITRDPNEWKFVEWAIPKKIVPPAPKESKEYPSGWGPSKPESLNHPYFVGRSKNHMMSVYFERSNRGIRRITKIRRVQGNIALLGKEMQDFLSKKLGKEIGMKINEPAGTIKFRGDYTSLCIKFLEEKGF